MPLESNSLGDQSRSPSSEREQRIDLTRDMFNRSEKRKLLVGPNEDKQEGTDKHSRKDKGKEPDTVAQAIEGYTTEQFNILLDVLQSGTSSNRADTLSTSPDKGKAHTISEQHKQFVKKITKYDIEDIKKYTRTLVQFIRHKPSDSNYKILEEKGNKLLNECDKFLLSRGMVENANGMLTKLSKKYPDATKEERALEFALEIKNILDDIGVKKDTKIYQ